MDFIPKVKLDFKPEENETVNEETKEQEPNFIYDEESEPIDQTVDINPSMHGMSEDKHIEEETIFEDIPKKPKKEKKPRKPMSEEHKEKLKKAREKAMAVRKANALEKKRLKEIDNETKQLHKLKKEKDLKQLKNEVLSNPVQSMGAPPPAQPPAPAPAPAPVPLPAPPSSLTKKDLEEAQLQAIMKYESLRKERKKEKKVNQDELERKRKMRNKLMRAMNPQNNFSNFATGGF